MLLQLAAQDIGHLPYIEDSHPAAAVGSQLTCRLLTRSGEAGGEFSWEVTGVIRSQLMWRILTACAGDLAGLSSCGKSS
jgi:hypothetical protein